MFDHIASIPFFPAVGKPFSTNPKRLQKRHSILETKREKQCFSAKSLRPVAPRRPPGSPQQAPRKPGSKTAWESRNPWRNLGRRFARASATARRHRAETAFRSLLRRKHGASIGGRYALMTNSARPTTRGCREVPFAAACRWRSSPVRCPTWWQTCDVRTAGIRAKRPSTATGAAMPDASATRAADDERRR